MAFSALVLWCLLPLDMQGQHRSVAPAGNSQTICLPVQSIAVSSGFGRRIHPVTGKPDYHRGIDLRARNQPVYNIMDGVVSATGQNSFLGRYVRVRHGDFTSIYGHLSRIAVQAGEAIGAGHVIGLTGSTGRTTGEHLHFALLFKGDPIDPLQFFRALLLPDEPI